MMENREPSLIEQFEIVCDETSTLAPVDPQKAEMVARLKRVVGKIPLTLDAEKTIVHTKADADVAAQVIGVFDAQIKEISELLDKSVNDAFQNHRRWTNLRSLIATPFVDGKKLMRKAIIEWQDKEERKAREEAARLQAEADAKARREREALEKKAASMKTDEKKDEYLQKAEAVQSPVVHVEPPKADIRTQKRWDAMIENEDDLFKALAENPSLRGFVKADLQALRRAKSANVKTEVPGVKFFQKTI